MSTQPLDSRAIVLRWEWTLSAAPEVLWPSISDTNRMNVLAGMAPVRFTDTPLPAGGSRRIGTSKMLGMDVSWDEHPFRWVYPESFQVLRQFHSGPLEAYISAVTLAPHGSGTRLTHTVRIVPRSRVLAPFVKLEGAQLQKKWERAYRMVDDHLSHGGPDPFGAPRRPKVPPAVGAIAERLVAAGHDAALVGGLVEFVLGAHETELQHIRPFMLAERWRAPRTTVLELLMTAAANGLVQARWSHLCPQCRGPKASASALEQLPAEADCPSCGIRFASAGEESIELAFRPAPAVREVSGATYCVGGPGATPHVVFQGELAPGEPLALALPVAPGLYRVRTVQSQVVVNHLGPERPEAVDARVTLSADGLAASAEVSVGPALRLVIESDRQAALVVVEQTAWGDRIATAGHIRATPSYQAFLAAKS